MKLGFLCALAACAVAGCANSAGLVCKSNDECVRQGDAGQCMEGFCAFQDGTCQSQFRWDETADESHANQCVTQPANRCTGTLEVPLTATGRVEAETTYSSFFTDFSARNAVDNNRQTSWFSAGPDTDRTPTWYRWLAPEGQVRCIQRVLVQGNGRHSDVRFQRDFGFEEVTVQVLRGDELVFSRFYPLTDTPDPDVEVLVDGVLGTEVRLQFSGHEDESCGGFSELVIAGLE